MGTQGVPHGYTKSEISEAIIKCQGRISHAARELKLHWKPLYEYFAKYPEMWDIVDNARKSHIKFKKKLKVDLSETYQDNLLTKDDVPYAIGLRASMYILDNLGEEEGYNNEKNDDKDKEPPQQDLIDKENENMSLKAQLALVMKKVNEMQEQLDNQSKTGSELPRIDPSL